MAELTRFVNSEFQKVVQFFRSHKLALHPNKTQFLLFTNSNHARDSPPSIFINNNNVGEPSNPQLLHSIPNVNSNSPTPAVKFLGIYIDPLLNFKYHIENISRKLSTALYFLRTAKHTLSFKALKSLYYSIFHSHLIYGIQVWSSTAASNLSALEKKQKQAVRIINKSSYNAHTEPLFKSSLILPLRHLSDFFALQFVQHFVQGFLPKSFNDTWINNVARRQDEYQMRLKNDDDLSIPFARLNSIERQPLIRFPRLWHEFSSDDIKSIRNKLQFNKQLKDHFLSKLDINYKCGRLLCPHCSPPDRLLT